MKTQPVTFAAMTDLHLDIMHDGMMRIDAFLDAEHGLLYTEAYECH